MQKRTKQNLRNAILAISVLCVGIVGAVVLERNRGPEICSLCGSGEVRPFHAPVLIDLSTGDSIELRVYDMEIANQMEISQEQTTGTFYPLHFEGHTGYRDTCDQTCRVYLPEDNPSLKNKNFCKACRAILEDYKDAGFVLADLYNREEVEIYGISEGVTHTIRDYEVTVQWNTEVEELEVLVHGTIEGLTFID